MYLSHASHAHSPPSTPLRHCSCLADVHYRAQLLQSLALLPFEYLPEPVITSLGLSWVHLLPFLPCRTTEDLVFLADWARLVFKAACHLEDHAMVQALCTPLVSFLVRQALEQAQGKQACQWTSCP